MSPRTALARLLQELELELRDAEARGLRRRLRELDADAGPTVRIDGRTLVCWGTNDYLGLAADPRLAAAAAEAAAAWGIGARASRLVTGTSRWHTALERALAEWFGTDAALVFPSGYQANLGALGALLGPADAVVIDRLAHASLIDAARLTGARLRVFHHNDAAHARRVLARTPGRRRLLVTEGLFSMEGDPAPLRALVEAAEAAEASVFVDDAHGAFVLGATGRGAPEAAGLAQDRVLYLGTLGKALGCQGGFVAGPRLLIDALINRARAFLYTTALATPVAAAAAAAVRLVADEPWRRQQLWDRCRELHAQLSGWGYGPAEPSPILPVTVGDAESASALAEALAREGHLVPAIRPPTVPRGTARLRISVSAAHTADHVRALAGVLRRALPR